MRTIIGRLLLFAMTGVLGVALLTLSRSSVFAAQQQRPIITGTIILREGEKITLNRGYQDGLRKNDKLQVSHTANGKVYLSGTLLVTHVNATTADAKITDQNGVVGPEDLVTLILPEPAPARSEPVHKEPVHKAPVEPTRKTPKEKEKPEKPKESEPALVTPTETVRKTIPTFPLLPQFSADKAGGANFTFDYTNDGEKFFDTALYRTSAHLIFDDQDYRTRPVTLTGNYNLDPGKTRTFSFNLTDFMITADKDVWPLKSGRHTVLIKFGGKQYGPLLFDWRGDTTTP